MIRLRLTAEAETLAGIAAILDELGCDFVVDGTEDRWGKGDNYLFDLSTVGVNNVPREHS